MSNVIPFKPKLLASRKKEFTPSWYVTRLSENLENTEQIMSISKSKDGTYNFGWTRMQQSEQVYMATILMEQVKMGMYEDATTE